MFQPACLKAPASALSAVVNAIINVENRRVLLVPGISQEFTFRCPLIVHVSLSGYNELVRHHSSVYVLDKYEQLLNESPPASAASHFRI